ncbi:PREDICTED: increased DNA methylation 1-like isoform X2 [Ipomoea nil]|uniref:increased DNA methylation 1-like isoform X2 n=1 Tax=Ipomoea nil TaxID=35883 RepID=UPI000900D892|nr:PREDICTED: increased DNA methylation 1-like isoform X2 [Ipomoea nil]
MEESVRSGGVVKKKSSSGCLIIRKKDDRVGGMGMGMGMGGIGPSGSFQKDRKRPRKIMMNDSESSDELPEPNSHNGSVMYRSGVEDKGIFRRNGEIENDRKRNRLGLEFNGYNEFDRRNEYREERLRMMGGMGSLREFENGPVRDVMIEKRKHSYFDSSGSSNMVSARARGVDYGAKNRYEQHEDEVHCPISSMRLKYQEASDEPIRVQGKNGVLKVMVNKKKKMDLLHNNEFKNVENRKASMSHVKKEPRVQPALFADYKHSDLRPLPIEREKSELKSQKPLREETTSTADSETDGARTPHKVAPLSSETGCSVKRVKEEEIRPSASAAETLSAVNKDGKVKRGGSTEKQQLRERIRGMLIEAGWTIDYRPRKNRDYLDAVYISPSGTAYWSIIKAYDAFQKHLEGDTGKNKSDGISAPFAPLSADLINKLTRQTRKKIEKEMKKKKKDESASSKKKALVKEHAEGTDSDQHDERLDSYIKKNGKPLKGKFHATKQKNEDKKNYNASESGRLKQDMVVRSTTAPTRNIILGKKSQIIGRCTLLVRSFEKGENPENDGYVPFSGKRTLLAWMIDSGTVKLSEKVQYMNRRKSRVKLEGWITRDGIHCGCCSKILTVSKFELHAGSKLRQPFQNIVLESGVSLLQCLIDSWNRQKESECRDFYALGIDGDDPDDDTCGVCGDGGDLICCDGCPSTFHQTCLGIEMLPPGDWHCPNCTCKFCGVANGNLAEGNEDADELLFCDLCEKKYHKSCGQEENALPMNTNNVSTFCSNTCQELYDHLQKILGVKHELESGFSWSLIQRSELDSDTSHRTFPQRVESNSKLALTLSIMNECFLPIVDRRSEINIIQNVVYNCGSNFSRLNYRGFYTAILERGDEIISAASIRIHGTQLAEMPFIGTRYIYRRQGMCRRLLSSIEMVLSSLRVEKLIIPAISDNMNTWTSVFGFKKLEESHKHEMKSMNMLVFPGTDMLQKQLVMQEASDGLKSVELGLVEKPRIRLSAKHKGDVCNDSDLRGMKQNHAVGERMGSGSSASDVHMHDVMMVRPHNSSCVSSTKLSSKKTSSTKSDGGKKVSKSSTTLKHASILGEKADESSSRSAGEGANENPNQLSVSGICGNKEETVLRSNSESDHRANSEASSDAEMMPINRDLSSSLEPSGKPDLNQSHTPDDMKGVEGNSNMNRQISPNVKSNLTMTSELESETKGPLAEGTVPGAMPGVSAQCCAEEMMTEKDSKMCFKHDLNLQADMIKE